MMNTNEMELITTHICKGMDIGIHGNMFGGIMMALIDDASAAFAMQICKTPSLVTVKADEFIFKKPVKAGNIVKIYGKVLEFGRTSVTLYIESRTYDPSTGTEVIVTHTNIKFVRIDENGNSVPIDDEVKMNYK